MYLQGFCTADSPSWCGHLIHTGSSSASPVHLSSSSAHSCVWPDHCRPLLCLFCLAGVLVFAQSPFYAWTWTKNDTQCNTNMELDTFLDILWSYLLLTHGTVFHEVADLATDAAAAVIRSHFSLSEDFRIKEILLRQMKTNHTFNRQLHHNMQMW